MNFDDDIIGRGWSFPPSFNHDSGRVEMTTGIEDINNSLAIIFNTELGERLMNPKFGCSIRSQLLEPMTTGTIAYMQHLLQTAILYHESRIDPEQVQVQADQQAGRLDIAVTYTVRGTNSRFNYVYPFYLAEAPI